MTTKSTNILPTSEIDLYQKQLIGDIHTELFKKQQLILANDLSRGEFTNMLKSSLEAIRNFQPTPIP